MSRRGSELGLPYLCISHLYGKNVFVISLERNKIDRNRWKLRLLSLRRRINTIKMSDVLTLTDLLNRLALMITTSIFKVQINIYRGSVLKGKKKHLVVKMERENILTKFLMPVRYSFKNIATT